MTTTIMVGQSPTAWATPDKNLSNLNEVSEKMQFFSKSESQLVSNSNIFVIFQKVLNFLYNPGCIPKQFYLIFFGDF